MFRPLSLIAATALTVLISVSQAEISIKEIGDLLDVASKEEGILLISLDVIVNGIKKVVNEDIYNSEKISEAAGKCAAKIGEQAIKMTENTVGTYVGKMIVQIEKLSGVLKNHSATQEELESAKKQLLAKESEILLELSILKEMVLQPESVKLSNQMEQCKELK